jgi:hypothetical protein
VELVPGSHSSMDPDSMAVGTDLVVAVDRAVGTFPDNTAIFVPARSSSWD